MQEGAVLYVLPGIFGLYLHVRRHRLCDWARSIHVVRLCGMTRFDYLFCAGMGRHWAMGFDVG